MCTTSKCVRRKYLMCSVPTFQELYGFKHTDLSSTFLQVTSRPVDNDMLLIDNEGSVSGWLLLKFSSSTFPLHHVLLTSFSNHNLSFLKSMTQYVLSDTNLTQQYITHVKSLTSPWCIYMLNK